MVFAGRPYRSGFRLFYLCGDFHSALLILIFYGGKCGCGKFYHADKGHSKIPDDHLS